VIASTHGPRCGAAEAVADEIAKHIPRLAAKRGRNQAEPFPLSAIPLQQIVAKVETGHYSAIPSWVFSFEEVAEAHRVMERSEANGKLVVAGA
jgi:NADPH:quinone reductase-like Zn-dependent oxidoreductase